MSSASRSTSIEHALPATAGALAAGDITAAHAHRLASLNAPVTARAFREAEESLVDQARTMRWADFTEASTYWRRAASDDDPDPDKADRDHRFVSLHDGLRGTGLLTGELTPTAKTPPRRARRDGHTRQRRAPRRQAPPTPAHRPGWLRRLQGHLRAGDGSLVSPGTVADLLDDAVIERIVFDGPSRVLDLGHARSFAGAVRRAIEVRDRHCQGPGCPIPAPPATSTTSTATARAAPPTPTTAEPTAASTTADASAPRRRPHHPAHPATGSPGSNWSASAPATG